MVPPDATLDMVEGTRAKVLVVKDTSNVGAPSVMDFAMDFSVIIILDFKTRWRLISSSWTIWFACFAMSDFGGTHGAFRLMNTCAVRRYGFLLRTLPMLFADRTLIMQI
jgi:hypothetical protein